jgi:5-methyltetrahydropteroyltriglutamate--homocysteine methyltransferase
MARAHVLGYPRIGPRRELKLALESHWRGQAPAADLLGVASRIREANWRAQREAGLDMLTAGDFSLYDHVLDAAHDVGIELRGGQAGAERLARYFRLARGDEHSHALEMTKWFDTNYHYLVPRLEPGQVFTADASRLVAEVRNCAAIHTSVKPVLLGPLSLLRLSKCKGREFDRLSLLPALVQVYDELFAAMRREGVEWIQLDEPCLVLELEEKWLAAYEQAISAWRRPRPKLLLTTYFESVEADPARIASWPFDGIHLDLVRAPAQLQRWRKALPPAWVLSAGIVDGRSVWRNDLSASLDTLAPAADLGERLWVAPSCSLLHVPICLAEEEGIDPPVRARLAFAQEKLREASVLASALTRGRDSVAREIAACDAARRSLPPPPRRPDLHATPRAPFPERRAAQKEALHLPLLPTTTIGSFPQTPELRAARAAFRRGGMGESQYLQRLQEEIRRVVAAQEELGLDVLVHGEPERNDMVEFFAERLDGFVTTSNGWVQSYGSRCTKPPIVCGDIARPVPMTLEITRFAQSLTRRPMKGMLTGPITIAKWSFVRGDVDLLDVAEQIALCLREEIDDLQDAGIGIVQVDEPALREAMPLKARAAPAWLERAIAAFRLAASTARPATQIHTHMCYSEFEDLLPAIASMDADVVTLETSRSGMALLDALRAFSYPNEVGPGVYDIHSPRVPSTEEIQALIERAACVVPLDRLWVNPDCGLKTRGWPETREALRNMVSAARRERARQATSPTYPRSS